MTRLAPFVAAIVAYAAAIGLAFFSGGFFDDARLVAGIVVWLAVAFVMAFGERPLPRSRTAWLAIGALAALAAWTLISLAWAPLAGRVEDDAQRLALYLGFSLLALFACSDARSRRWLEPLLLAGLVAICLEGLSERLLPSLFQLDRSQTAAGRLEQPLTYWNGLGMVAAWAWLLGARIAGDGTRSHPLRAVAAASTPLTGLALYLTFSRAGIAAAAAGAVVLLAFAPNGRQQLRALAAAVAAATLASLLANELPTVRSATPGMVGDPGDGALMLGALLALGGATALIGVSPRSTGASERLRLPVGRGVAVLAGTGLALTAAAVAVALSDVRPNAQSPVRGANPQRLGSIDTNRYTYWRVAVEMAAREPVRGEGSGSFAAVWRARDNRPDRASDAHSLYLETLAELGIVGFAALASFIGALLLGGAGALRRHPAVAVGPTALLVAWLVHAAVDWDWEMPAATLPALFAGCALLAWGPEERALSANRQLMDASYDAPTSQPRSPRSVSPAATAPDR